LPLDLQSVIENLLVPSITDESGTSEALLDVVIGSAESASGLAAGQNPTIPLEPIYDALSESTDVAPSLGLAPIDVVVDAPQESIVRVQRDWLESRIPFPAAPGLQLLTLDGNDYYEFTAGLDSMVSPFDAEAVGLRSFGSIETVLAHDRLMDIRLVAAPDWTERLHPVMGANGTFDVPEARNPVLSVSFEDDDHAGQPLWYSLDWLESLGIFNPQFTHEDGSAVAHGSSGATFWSSLSTLAFCTRSAMATNPTSR
jgi:hypothetical protein